MKLLLPREKLKEALTGLAKVVNTRSSLPILSHVRLDADKALRLTGTDLDQTLTYTLESVAPLPEPVSMLIPMDTLRSVLKGTQGPTIEVETTGKNEVVIGCNQAGHTINRRVSVPDTEDWPALTEQTPTKPVEAQLLEHIRQALPFASRDESRYVLNGVYLDVKDKDCHRVVATDGRRMSSFNSVRLPLTQSVILPSSKFLIWSKLDGEPQIGADSAKEVFTLTIGPWTYTTKTVSGSYPNWRQVVPAGDAGRSLELSAEDIELLIKALPGLPSHLGCGDAVILRMQPEGPSVYTRESTKAGESSIRLENSVFTGKPLSIGVDRRFFIDAMKAGFQLFEFADNISPLVGRLSKEDKHSVHVLMPMRTADTEKAGSIASKATVAESRSVQKPSITSPEATITKEKPMPKNEEPKAETTSLDRILVAYETAKSAVRDANTALTEVATAVRDAIKEDKVRRREIADVRNGLAKLQSIKV